MEDFKPRMMDPLTDAVILIDRAVDCMQTVFAAKDIMIELAQQLNPCIAIHDPSKQEEAVVLANDALRILISRLAKIETARAMLEELKETVEGDFKRRVADNLQNRKLTLYGVNVS